MSTTISILIIKTAALGDVVRTTSILTGLRGRDPDCEIVWVTSRAAFDLVRTHPLITSVEVIDPRSEEEVGALSERLTNRRWSHVISLDDEPNLCRLAASVKTEKLSGAYMTEDGRRLYTADVAPWFDMGLLSTFGKARADELKVLNQKSHPRIYADMLGIAMGKYTLVLPGEACANARDFSQRHGLEQKRPLIGLNTGADGRWFSKQLSVERTVELSRLVSQARGGNATFIVFGGPAEVERNRAIMAGLQTADISCVNAGCNNSLLDFAALVGLCDVLVTSDSLALHIAIALDVRTVAYFAPTSAAEIEFYGLGESISSTAPDYCSYRAVADNSTITPERLLPCVERQLVAAAQVRR